MLLEKGVNTILPPIGKVHILATGMSLQVISENGNVYPSKIQDTSVLEVLSKNEFNLVTENTINEYYIVGMIESADSKLQINPSDANGAIIRPSSDFRYVNLAKIYLYKGEWKVKAVLEQSNSLKELFPELAISFTYPTPASVQVSQPMPAAVAPVSAPAPAQFNLEQYQPRVPVNQELTKMEVAEFRGVQGIQLGLGWKSLSGNTGTIIKALKNQKLTVDMDMQLIPISSEGVILEQVTAFTQRSRDNAIFHFGNRGENSDGAESENATISLQLLNPAVEWIAVRVSSKERNKFDTLEKISLKIYNQLGMIPLGNYNSSWVGSGVDTVLIGLIHVLPTRDGIEFITTDTPVQYHTNTEISNWVKFIQKMRGIQV